MKTLTALILLLTLFIISCKSEIKSVKSNHVMGTTTKCTESEKKANYDRGYTDALYHFTLLNLELQLKEERKTFGEMNTILFQRHNIDTIQSYFVKDTL